MVSPQQKVTSQHLERLAIVYPRQSTPRQVRQNIYSTELQYGLSEQAARLGWDPERILTLDADLGVSGQFTDGQGRAGFKELVARVCLGEVGAILGLDVSRLARSSAETQRLLEYCALTDTLVIDTDRIYDLREFDDQLVLGVKGQLAQAELHVMAVRLQGAKRHAAERGELRFPLAVGYLHDDQGEWITDPDQEVQAAVTDVFKAFHQTGSAFGVVGAFAGRRFPTRVFGAWAGELRWGPLTHHRVVRILKNPCYAGAYVFGRHRSRRVVSPEGKITTKTVELPRSEWTVVIHDHHPAYIGWDEYLANQQRLLRNHTRAGQRPPREGTALSQGIVRCGACGHSMTVHYCHKSAHYDCSASRANHIQTEACRSVKAAVIDELVARRLLAALEPEQIALALNAADALQDRQARANRALQLRVERARYEAIRAERAFHQCEPDNRLVARSLEDRWEEKLRELKDAEAQLAEHVVPSSEPSREQLEALARDLPALWAAKTTADKDRKRLLRALIADVTITSKPEAREVEVGIRWRSGASEQHTIERPPTYNDTKRTPPQAIQLIARLAPHRTNAEIAAELNAAGIRTGADLPFSAHAVRFIRRAYEIPATRPRRGGELTVAEVAERLSVSPGAIYYWVRHGQLSARRNSANRLRIPFPLEIERQCRERIANSSHIPQTKISATGDAV
jgi:DNA invertase Pin-like site-specific DNA recombinase